MTKRSMLGYKTRALERADVELIHGKDIGFPVIGLALVGADGRLIGIGGAIFHGNVTWAFGEVVDDVERSAAIIYRLTKRWLRVFVSLGGDNIWALRDVRERSSLNFLPRIGFEKAAVEDWPDEAWDLPSSELAEVWRYVGG